MTENPKSQSTGASKRTQTGGALPPYSVRRQIDVTADLMPPLWLPWEDHKYKPGERALFGGHIWIKRQEPGLWDPA